MITEKKKVLFVITKSVWGGAQRYVFDIATNLPKDTFETAIALGGNGSLYEKLTNNNIPIFSVPAFQKSINPLKDIKAFFELLAIYHAFKPDIIHTNSSKAGGIASIAAFMYRLQTRRHVLRVFTVHGWAFLEFWRPGWQRLLIRIASKLTAMLHNKIIVISEYDHTAVSAYNVAPLAKVTVITNGIGDIPFLPRAQAQQKLLGREYPFVIGAIAEWTKNKGLEYLIAAFPEIQKQCPHIKLCLVGWGELMADLKLQIANLKLEEHIFLVSQSPAAPYIKAFDVFVLPSRKEGLPYTVLEAGLAGVPVVATRVGGLPDIIPNEQHGSLVSPADTNDLMRAVIELCKNTAKRNMLAENLYNRVRSVFSLSEMIQKTIEVYKK